jgi:hypothetical protein
VRESARLAAEGHRAGGFRGHDTYLISKRVKDSRTSSFITCEHARVGAKVKRVGWRRWFIPTVRGAGRVCLCARGRLSCGEVEDVGERDRELEQAGPG